MTLSWENEIRRTALYYEHVCLASITQQKVACAGLEGASTALTRLLFPLHFAAAEQDFNMINLHTSDMY